MRRGDWGELAATARAHGTSVQALLQRRDTDCLACGRPIVGFLNRRRRYHPACHAADRAASRDLSVAETERRLAGLRPRQPSRDNDVDA